jgi:hypothetical protein
MKVLLPLVGLGAAAAVVAANRRDLGWEVKKHSHLGGFEEHFHEAKQHQHQHTHITHNRRQGPDMAVGEWEHLTAVHEHAHNHPSLGHAHLPHQDAEHEHLGEAHIHDHEHPTVS